MRPAQHWDEEAEVVVVGFGGAGIATAITAHEAGAKVLILEKQPADTPFPYPPHPQYPRVGRFLAEPRGRGGRDTALRGDG